MLSEQEALKYATDTVIEAFVGVLTTVNRDGQPYSRCMGAAMGEQGLNKLYTLTAKGTQKLKYIEQNPAVCWVFSTDGYQRVVSLRGVARVLSAPTVTQQAWDRLSQAAQAYSMNALSDTSKVDFLVIETEVQELDLLYPSKGVVNPMPLKPTQHV